MVEHSTLTGADLHEPKGVAAASANEVYHADGLGSGSWSDPLDRVKNLNSVEKDGVIADVSTAGSNVFFYINRACTLTKLSTVLYGTLTVADAILSIYKNNVLQAQTLTIPFTGSGIAVTNVLNLSPSYTFVDGDVIEIRSDGGSTGAIALAVSLLFTAT